MNNININHCSIQRWPSAVTRMPGNYQTGAVLVVSLVLLTVLTLIGVTSMTSSTLELRVAGNAQQRNIAFQAAQSRIAFASATDSSNPINFLIAIDVTDPSTWPVQTCNPADGCVDGPDWTATADVSYLACNVAQGSSLEGDKSVAFRYFEIRAEGKNSTGAARSLQAAAIRFPVKACGDENL